MAEAPTVTAPQQGISSSPLGIQAPAEAFGAGVVGEGLAKAGQALGQGSNILEQHAVALQEINNKANADAAYSAAVPALNNRLSDFVTNYKGQDASAALPKFQQEMETARQSFAQGLTPMAAQYYNQETRRLQANMFATMRTHADQQQAKFVLDSSEAKVAAGWQAASANPTEGTLNEAVATTMDEVHHQAQLVFGQNVDPEVTQARVAAAVSANFVKMLDGMKGTDPIGAWEFAKQHQDLLYGADKGAIAQLKRVAIPQMVAEDASSVVATHASGAANPQRPTTAFSGLQPEELLSGFRADAKGEVKALTGLDVTITSGARTAAQNARLPGASSTSEHLSNAAWDMVPPPGVSTVELAQKIHDSGIPYDQLEVTNTHVHVGFNPNGNQREQVIGNLAAQVSVQPALPGQAPNSVQFRAQLGSALSNVDALAAQRFPGENEAGDREAYAQTLTQSIMRRYGQQYQVMRDGEAEASAAIMDKVIQGKLEDPSQLSASDRATLASLPPSYQLGVLSTMRQDAEQWTLARQTNAERLNVELANSRNDPQTFLNEDVGSLDLTRSSRMQFMKAQANLQATLQQRQQSDSVLNRALGSAAVGGYMRQFNIQQGSPDYDHLVGGLQAEISAWPQTHDNKMPTDQDIDKTIIPAVMAKQHRAFTNQFLGFDVGTSTEGPPSEDIEAARKSLAAEGIANPNEQQIYRRLQEYYIYQRSHPRGR